MMSQEFTRFLSSELNFHDIHDVCPESVMQKVRDKTSDHRSKRHRSKNRIEFVLSLADMTTTLQHIFELFKDITQDQLGIREFFMKNASNLSIKFHLGQILLNDMFASGIGKKEVRQTCYFSVAYPQKSKTVLDQNSWHPQNKFSYTIIHFGDVSAECITRVVGRRSNDLVRNSIRDFFVRTDYTNRLSSMWC